MKTYQERMDEWRNILDEMIKHQVLKNIQHEFIRLYPDISHHIIDKHRDIIYRAYLVRNSHLDAVNAALVANSNSVFQEKIEGICEEKKD